MLRRLVALCALVVFPIACGSGGGSTGGNGSGSGNGPVAPQPDSTCGSVRMTYYELNGSRGWCEFDRTLPILPAFVRSGLTTAIAEPYDGGSYGGQPGEACGECWEVATLGVTRTVMVDNLCPIEGNPICAGDHFHMDLSHEAATALQMNGLEEGQARRVPCPVSGNIFLEILDRNQSGYLRFAVVNHRVPVRAVEYRSAAGATWRAARRDGGAWAVMNDAQSDMFASGEPGGVFRFTSAQGELVEGTAVLSYAEGKGQPFDTGAQLTDQAPAAGAACVFEPPGLVYGDGYGGITDVSWKPGAWDGATVDEVTGNGCFGGQGSCLDARLPQWNGFGIMYVQAFPTSTFARLSLRLRSPGGGTVRVAASLDGTTCQNTEIAVGPDWAQTTIALASTCANLASIRAVTVQAETRLELFVDDVRFEK